MASGTFRFTPSFARKPHICRAATGFLAAVAALCASGAGCAAAAQGFTLQQALSAPVASSLTAAPRGALFAWVENAEGRRNLWVASPTEPARQLTHYTEDDGQELTQLAWSPEATQIAYVYGAETGASGQPANPAHLQRPTALELIVQPLAADAQPISLPRARQPLFLDEHTLLFVRDGAIWSATLTAQGVGQTHQLVFDRGSATSLTLSPDRKLLAYVSLRRQPTHPAHAFIALYDFGAKSLRFLAPSTGVDFAPTFSPDGKMLAWLRHPFLDTPEFATNRVSATPWSIQVWDFEKNEGHMVYQPEPNKPGSAMPRFAHGEPRVWWHDTEILFCSEVDGWLHLYSVDLSGGAPVLLTPGDYEVNDVIVHDSQAYFSGNSERVVRDDACPRPPCMIERETSDPKDRDRQHLFYIPLQNEIPHAVQLTSGIGNEVTPAVTSNGALAALTSTPNRPMSAALVQVRGHVTLLHTVHRSLSFVTPQQILYDAADGIHLHSQLFEPATPQPASGKRAAIIYVHGGPKRQMYLGYPDGQYYSNAYAMNQYLTSRGFIVLSVNYRCGIGYGLEFRQCEDSGATGAKEYNDVLAAVNYLRSRPDVDPKRIGIWGGSYGGYLTALALARNSDLFAAGVDFHGVHDWVLEDNRDDWLRGTNAEQDAIAAKAHASSPLADIDKWRSPVLLIQGDDDPDVAYAQTPTLAEALEAHHVPHETLVFPDEVHSFLLHRDWLAAYEAAAKFFERTLQPEK